MNEATIAQTIMTALIFAIFFGYFVWAIRTGQFKNIEEAKYNMFSSPDKTCDKQAQEPEEGEKKA
jgi:cbb3-type cytochrome oxidase subunit 3